MNKTKTQTKSATDREAVRVLAIELGARGTARRLSIKESTVLSWARRYSWSLPKRKGGGNGKNAITLAIKPGDALIAHHKGLEGTTKTALMQTLAKAAQQVAGKEPLDITNPAQLQALCLAAARIFGWQGDSQVNVEVNNQVGVVVSEAKRAELQAKLKAIQDDDNSEEHGSAPITLPSLQTQPQASTGARNSPPEAYATAPASIFIMPGGEGVQVSPEILRPSISPSLQEFLEAESVGW
jgi:hypothetical protein